MQWKYWLNHDLFSAQWWAILILNAIFLILFILLIDRQRLLLISLTFMVSIFLIGLIDETGNFFNKWNYPHQFVPFSSRFNAVDFALIPVTISLIYQTFSRWIFFLVAFLIVDIIIAFIGIPIFVYFHLYQPHNWNYFSSFIVLYLVGIMIKWIVDFILKRK